MGDAFPGAGKRLAVAWEATGICWDPERAREMFRGICGLGWSGVLGGGKRSWVLLLTGGDWLAAVAC